MAKCPKCEKTCSTIKLQEIDASSGLGATTWRGVYYCCPWCQTILGASLDPIAMKNDIAALVVKKLKGAN